MIENYIRHRFTKKAGFEMESRFNLCLVLSGLTTVFLIALHFLYSSNDLTKYGQIGDSFNVLTSIATIAGVYYVYKTLIQMRIEYDSLSKSVNERDLESQVNAYVDQFIDFTKSIVDDSKNQGSSKGNKSALAKFRELHLKHINETNLTLDGIPLTLDPNYRQKWKDSGASLEELNDYAESNGHTELLVPASTLLNLYLHPDLVVGWESSQRSFENWSDYLESVIASINSCRNDSFKRNVANRLWFQLPESTKSLFYLVIWRMGDLSTLDLYSDVKDKFPRTDRGSFGFPGIATTTVLQELRDRLEQKRDLSIVDEKPLNCNGMTLEESETIFYEHESILVKLKSGLEFPSVEEAKESIPDLDRLKEAGLILTANFNPSPLKKLTLVLASGLLKRLVEHCEAKNNQN